MEFLLLGLLILSPMTGYELQQFIRQNLSLICSHSAGSVQTALAKLERRAVSLPVKPPRETGEKRFFPLPTRDARLLPPGWNNPCRRTG